MPTEATTETFDELVLNASPDKPIVVDFWAPWCQPCLMLAPTLEALADEAGERWQLVKVDVQQEPQLAAKFGIQGIPCLKAFVGGEIKSEIVGNQSANSLKDWIDTFA
ncbi:MAG: thioredoxin family protein [Acidobacteriota bacterium]